MASSAAEHLVAAPSHRPPRAGAGRRWLVSGLGTVVAAGVLWLTFRDVHWGQVAALVAGLGASVLVPFVPQLGAFIAETLGWQRLIAAAGHRLPFWPLLRVRVATEAVLVSLPAGVLWCESLKPVLLARHCALPLPAGVAAAAGRKYMRLCSHALYIAAAFVLGFATLRRCSSGVIGVAGLSWLVLATALLLAAGSVLMGLGMSKSALAERLLNLVGRVGGRRVRARLASRRQGFCDADVELTHMAAAPGRSLPLPVALGWVAWLMESVETLLILRLLGIHVGLGEALAIEATVNFARQLLFVLPAGLGVQDAGYVAFLAALAVPHAVVVGAAFALLKRARELVYTVIGYSTFALPAPHRTTPRVRRPRAMVPARAA